MEMPTNVTPTDKSKTLIEDIKPDPTKDTSRQGIVELTLSETTKVKVVGLVYGMEHIVQDDGYSAKLFLDLYNQRIRITYYEGDNIEGLIMCVRWLAEQNNFDKIVFNASQNDWQKFLPHGFVLEAVIKHYLNGKSAYVMSKFRSQERLVSHCLMEEILLIEQLMGTSVKGDIKELPSDFQCRLAKKEDIPALVKLYNKIFESYPSPLCHEEYLETVFQKMSIFSVITHNDVIVSAASAELNPPLKAAELTDCATLPEYRGKGLMSVILKKLETELISRDYICGYTIARARSYGMNNVFYQLGYEFMGRLVNNCDIYGAYEDMNIWVKKLPAQKKKKS